MFEHAESTTVTLSVEHGLENNALPKGKLLQQKNTLAVFCSPSRYTQGKNATASLGEEMAYLGLDGAALVVSGSPPIPSLDEIWKQTFNSSGIKHTIHPFGGECSLAEIERIKNAATDNQSDVIVASGGGKVLDALVLRPPI